MIMMLKLGTCLKEKSSYKTVPNSTILFKSCLTSETPDFWMFLIHPKRGMTKNSTLVLKFKSI